jgi:hypothetical protein
MYYSKEHTDFTQYLFIYPCKDSKLYNLVLLNFCFISFHGPPSHLSEAGAPISTYENLIAYKILS